MAREDPPTPKPLTEVLLGELATVDTLQVTNNPALSLMRRTRHDLTSCRPSDNRRPV